VLFKLDNLAKRHSEYEALPLWLAWKPQRWENVEYDPGTAIECDGEILQPPPDLEYTLTYFDQVDVFPVYLDRGAPELKQKFERRVDVPNSIQLEPFAQAAQELRRQHIPLDDIERETRTYRLLSAIIHQGESREAAHYTTLLRVPAQEGRTSGGDQWYVYDDLRQSPYQKISKQRAKQLLQTRSLMLFYYPYATPPKGSRPKEPAVKKVRTTKDREERKQKKQQEEERKEKSVQERNPEAVLFGTSEPFGKVQFDQKRRMKQLVKQLRKIGFDSMLSQQIAPQVIKSNPVYRGVDRDIETALNLLTE